MFLDRDGVLTRTVVRDRVPHPPRNLSEVEIPHGVEEALALLAGHGFKLIIVTNQPDVARGVQTREAVDDINRYLSVRLRLDHVFVCFHDGDDACDCRKPKAGLLTEAARLHNINLARSFMIGDRWSDVVAGQMAGCTTCLLDVSYNERERCAPDHLVRGLLEAARVILAVSKGS